MNKNSAAQKAQTDDFLKNHLYIVKPGATVASEKVSNLQANAEDVKSEPIVNTEEQKQIEQEAKAPEETSEVKEQPIIIATVQATIEDIKRKAELLTRLSAKYDDLVEKRKRMENFSISHDNDTAEILLHDAKGESFKSNSPKAIAKFIEFCKEEFSEVIKDTENQMREIA